MIRPVAVLSSMSLLLAACGQDPVGNATSPFADGFRTSFREKFITQCTAGAQSTSHLPKDFSVVCGCVADRLMADKSAVELLKGPSAEDTRKYAAICLQEHPIS